MNWFPISWLSMTWPLPQKHDRDDHSRHHKYQADRPRPVRQRISDHLDQLCEHIPHAATSRLVTATTTEATRPPVVNPGRAHAVDVQVLLFFIAVVGVAAGLVFGLAAGPVVGLDPTRWMSYTFARGWLAFRGQLPWPLMAFLADAHQRGVLRQAGATYQFRHLELQHRLATRP